jgi:hypothetical protein
MTTLTLTLTDLATSAQLAGFRAEAIGTGGNVRALSLTVDGHSLLLSLGEDGEEEGSVWFVSTDGETREVHGEREAGPFPVTSDADQTVRDVAAWWRGSDVD